MDRRRFLGRACIAAGVKPFGYHAIRHLTATELFHAGHPVSLIQHILRHKNPNTTARYLHSLGLDNALERIDGTF
ncbi:tyrosine-type recombinase/integrase [Pseudodesulfovibrio sp.]|uniref:tyrosine-type recombinase/integrase n=1 Tax=Pseudodesulfovibrio sp. TaxID=2035812 RepID=UPI002605A701|nr:tyrosine-type recombinase/integrase [Pseudodesulfovibrio sp.]MDD3313780.1 tyrosine-type recombinase/integrase [Pseudodesulfovibrio sp.]